MTAPNLKDFTGETLLNDEGKPVSLADFVGKRVLLFVFPRAATPGCTQQACGFRDAFPKIAESRAVVLGLSTDEPKTLAKWKAREKLPYMLLSDPDHKTIDRLGAWGERSLYGKKFMGTIRSHFVFGVDGAAEEAAVKISPKDSVAQGVAALTRP
ncbi:MAG TPA: peroxiredoxin [Aggregatilineales bacterium]|nr:peroxiredoxin [Aggregatilineales bacterium]